MNNMDCLPSPMTRPKCEALGMLVELAGKRLSQYDGLSSLYKWFKELIYANFISVVVQSIQY